MLVGIPAPGWTKLVRIPAYRWIILARISPPRWIMLVRRPGLACLPAAEPGRMRVQRPQMGKGLEDEEATQSRTDRAEAP
jgi:hypothetical protein